MTPPRRHVVAAAESLHVNLICVVSILLVIALLAINFITFDPVV